MSDRSVPEPDCPPGPFETDRNSLVQTPPQGRVPVADLRNANEAVPVEISRVRDGAVSYFRGGMGNQGVVTWYAFDVSRQIFVAVLGSSTSASKRVPRATKLAANQLLRETDAAGYARREYVTIIEATPDQVRAFGCLANQLLAQPADRSAYPVAPGALARTLALLLDGKPLDIRKGGHRSPVAGEVDRFIKEPMQDAILRAY